MIRVAKASLRYDEAGGSAPRATSISRRAMEILHAQLASNGAAPEDVSLGRVRVSVRVPHGASPDVVAHRVAGAIAARIPQKSGGT